MPENRILIVGRVGQVGWELRRKLACLGALTVVDFPEVDFSRPQTVREAVSEANPTVIVNAAAYTAVDKAETETSLAMAINADGPALLAEEAKARDALLVHYSTDYVFDGSKQTPWLETDVPNPLGVYGSSKLAGDLAIQASGCRHLIFRTSWVYGARGNNFLLTMLRLGRERSELRIVDDQTGAPTTSECIAQVTADVLSQLLGPRSAFDAPSGIYNLTCSGATTWFGFARALLTRSFARTGETLPLLTPIATAAYPTPARRPAYSCLDGTRLKETFGLALPPWETALDLVLDTLAAYAKQ